MNVDELVAAKILVTGGTGFLGQHLVRHLKEDLGCDRVFSLSNKRCDLRNTVEANHVFSSYKPDFVFHLAGYNGGIEFNRKYPAQIFANNTMMALNVIQGALDHDVDKVVSVVASCAYPAEEYPSGFNSFPKPREIMCEMDFLDGPPHGTVACHAYAKRNLQLASHFYNEQYGLKAVTACPTTLYGPGDSYDPQRTKVMGGMVKRFVDARRQNLTQVNCWGTGAAFREFLYVEDAAKLLVKTMLTYESSEIPINLGSGQELKVRFLAEEVARLAGYQGEIKWDTTKPDGQLRKRLNDVYMKRLFPEFRFTSLNEGIKKTIKDYEERHVDGRPAQNLST